MLDFTRIQGIIDVPLMQRSHVAIVGSASRFAVNQARVGLGKLSLVDFDRVSSSNVPRQEALRKDIGRLKIEATRDQIHAINPDVDVRLYPRDVTTFTDEEIHESFGDVDLFVFATDRFRAQAFCNTMALRVNKPALYLGLYPRGEAGEIVVVHPLYHDCCYRCLFPSRYKAHEEAEHTGHILDPASDGTMIADLDILDGFASKVALALLHAETQWPIGRLFHELGNRQLIQVKLSPEYLYQGADLFAQRLGIKKNSPHYAGWGLVTVTADPTHGQERCPICEEYRGDIFPSVYGGGRLNKSPRRPFQVATPSEAR